MFKHKVATRRILARSQSGLAVGVVVTLAMLAAACTDSVSSITAPSRQLLASNNKSISALNFTVLANAAVSCTGGSIAGSVGTFLTPPRGAVTQVDCPISGSIDIGNAAAKAAFKGFLAQYAALAPVAGNVCTELSGTLAGDTLPPGTYCFTAAAALVGTLTLEGSSTDIWIFKVGTSGTGALTGTDFSVVMAGAGQPCNVTWWVAQAVTMTTSSFQGNILAGAAITITDGPINGNLWAGASGVGDVTTKGSVVTGCAGSTGNGNGNGNSKSKCNQGVGNGPEGCDPGNSINHNGSNDENGGISGAPGHRQP